MSGNVLLKQMSEAVEGFHETDMVIGEDIFNALGGMRVKPRLKLWEVGRFFKCPLVGMCLTDGEQRRLLKKVGISYNKKTPYEIHEVLVSNTDDENTLSRRADVLLERKYGKDSAHLIHLEDQSFMSHFNVAVKTGAIADILWAAAVNPELSMKCRRKVFGEIHMTMHWTAEERLELTRKLAAQKEEMTDQLLELKNEGRRRRSLQKEVDKLRRELSRSREAVATLEKEKSEWARTPSRPMHDPKAETELKRENQQIQQEYEGMENRFKQAQRRIAVVEEENRELNAQLAQQIDINRHFKTEIQAVTDEMAALNRCDANCPAFDLCKKRVLVVGGITRMEYLYRELIESGGGVFDYHDGYVNKGVKGLETSLKRADVVLCPVNCNSHTACSIVKNLGKKHKKPVFMLANSSLSAVSKAILENDAA